MTIDTPSTLARCFTNTGYRVQLRASANNGSVTWSIESGTLPAGLSLAPSTGIISGDVDEAAPDGSITPGDVALTIGATDLDGLETKAVTMPVREGVQPIGHADHSRGQSPTQRLRNSNFRTGFDRDHLVANYAAVRNHGRYIEEDQRNTDGPASGEWWYDGGFDYRWRYIADAALDGSSQQPFTPDGRYIALFAGSNAGVFDLADRTKTAVDLAPASYLWKMSRAENAILYIDTAANELRKRTIPGNVDSKVADVPVNVVFGDDDGSATDTNLAFLISASNDTGGGNTAGATDEAYLYNLTTGAQVGSAWTLDLGDLAGGRNRWMITQEPDWEGHYWAHCRPAGRVIQLDAQGNELWQYDLPANSTEVAAFPGSMMVSQGIPYIVWVLTRPPDNIRSGAGGPWGWEDTEYICATRCDYGPDAWLKIASQQGGANDIFAAWTSQVNPRQFYSQAGMKKARFLASYHSHTSGTSLNGFSREVMVMGFDGNPNPVGSPSTPEGPGASTMRRLGKLPHIRSLDSSRLEIAGNQAGTVACARVNNESSGGNHTLILALDLEITNSVALPGGTTGQAYSHQVATTGADGAETWSVVSGALPDGLSISATGEVNGTPTTPGTFNFTLRVVDSTYALFEKAHTLEVTGAPASIEIETPATLTWGFSKCLYNVQLRAKDNTGTINWTVVAGALPPGMQLSAAGVLSAAEGALTNSGSFAFTIRATDDVANDEKAFNLLLHPNFGYIGEAGPGNRGVSPIWTKQPNDASVFEYPAGYGNDTTVLARNGVSNSPMYPEFDGYSPPPGLTERSLNGVVDDQAVGRLWTWLASAQVNYSLAEAFSPSGRHVLLHFAGNNTETNWENGIYDVTTGQRITAITVDWGATQYKWSSWYERLYIFRSDGSEDSIDVPSGTVNQIKPPGTFPTGLRVQEDGSRTWHQTDDTQRDLGFWHVEVTQLPGQTHCIDMKTGDILWSFDWTDDDLLEGGKNRISTTMIPDWDGWYWAYWSAAKRFFRWNRSGYDASSMYLLKRDVNKPGPGDKHTHGYSHLAVMVHDGAPFLVAVANRPFSNTRHGAGGPLIWEDTECLAWVRLDMGGEAAHDRDHSQGGWVLNWHGAWQSGVPQKGSYHHTCGNITGVHLCSYNTRDESDSPYSNKRRSFSGETIMYTANGGNITQVKGYRLGEHGSYMNDPGDTYRGYSFGQTNITGTGAVCSTNDGTLGNRNTIRISLWLRITTNPDLGQVDTNTPIDIQLESAGEWGATTWTPVDTLPGGVSLAPDGRLTGTPVAGSHTFSVRVTDGQFNWVEREFSLVVQDAAAEPYIWDGNYTSDFMTPANRIRFLGGIDNAGKPIEVTVDNSASQTEYGQVYQRDVKDASVRTVAEATNIAQTFLARLSFPRERIQLATYRDGLSPGMRIRIRNEALGWVDPNEKTMLIQQVRWEWVRTVNGQRAMLYHLDLGDSLPDIVEFLRRQEKWTNEAPPLTRTPDGGQIEEGDLSFDRVTPHKPTIRQSATVGLANGPQGTEQRTTLLNLTDQKGILRKVGLEKLNNNAGPGAWTWATEIVITQDGQAAAVWPVMTGSHYTDAEWDTESRPVHGLSQGDGATAGDFMNFDFSTPYITSILVEIVTRVTSTDSAPVGDIWRATVYANERVPEPTTP